MISLETKRAWRRVGLAGTTALAALLASTVVSAQQLPPDTLRLGLRTLPPAFGQPDQGTASPLVYALWPMYDSLTRVNLKSEVEPLLAVEWKNIDATTWQFKLRPNVKFSNGQTVNAQDVAGWFNYLMTDAGVGTVAGTNMRNLARLDSMRAIDPLTLEVKTKSPQPILPNMMSQAWVPEFKALRDAGMPAFGKAPVGTGPYKLVSWKNEEVEWTANETSWRAPRIKNLKAVTLVEAATRDQAILSGQIDIAQGLAFDSADRLTRDGHVMDYAKRPSVMGWRLFATSRPNPFNDKRVRQAANYAIDRESMSKNLLRGQAKPASQCATDFTNGYNPRIEPYTYQPQKAKQLLTEAGHPNGFDTIIEVITGSFPADAEIYQAAAANLTSVGIRVELRQIVFADWLKKWFVPAGTPTMGFVGGGFQNECHNDQMDAIGSFRNLSCRHTPAHHCDQDEMKLIEAVEAEFDPAKRKVILENLLALNKENAPMIWFTELLDVTGLHKRVQGFTNEIQRWNVHQVTFR